MEIRHLAAIVAAVCWVGWTQRTHIKSAVVAAWQRVAPMAKSAKASWLIPLAIGGGLLWPDIAKYLPKPSPVDPIVETDLVDSYFVAAEVSFRSLQGQKATKLRAGEFETEADSVKWFEGQFTDAKRIAVKPLLDYEYDQFGGEKWTPEGEAVIAEQWLKGGVE